MKMLKFTKQTEQVAFVFFTLYFVYGLFYTPFTQYLVSLAIGGIAYGITDSAEIAVVLLLAANYLFSVVMPKQGYTSYSTKVSYEGFEGEESDEKKEKVQMATMPIQGVGSPMSEGFANASDPDMTVSEKKAVIPDVSVGTSKPAAVDMDPADMAKMAEMMKKLMGNMNADALAPSKATKISEDNIPPAHQPQEKESFQESQTAGLFKLGQIPKDEKGGHHIDAGTTVMNAINALKPDQIKAMTMDTKQLIETQKSLMGMLQTFQPMVSEGKQMMETFQEMFSPAMGAMKTADGMISK